MAESKSKTAPSAEKLEEEPERVASAKKLPEGAATDWRAQLLVRANNGDKEAQAVLDRLHDKGSEEEMKAFASLGYSPAKKALAPADEGPEPSQPGIPVGTAVHGETTGHQTLKEK
jgi:hypothetical protein